MREEFLTPDKDQEFKDWHSNNPDGFYLNEQRKGAVMLHKVGCWHLQKLGPWPESGNFCTTAKFKIVSDSREELEKWAKVENMKLSRCGHCKI